MRRGSDAKSLWVSDLLPSRFPEVVSAIEQAIGSPVGRIPSTRDIWCRDYMPIEVAPGSFVQFTYRPSYLRGYRRLRTENAATLLGLEAEYTDIILDGGNVVAQGEIAVMTERVFAENRGRSQNSLMGSLKDLLRVRSVVIIPEEPGDVLGHADGMLAFIEEGVVVLNDYRKRFPALHRQIRSRLSRAGVEVNLLPYAPSRKNRTSIPSASGIYSNFVTFGPHLLVPVFGISEDDRCIRLLNRVVPNKRILGVPCTRVARKGGGVRCVVWSTSGQGLW